MITYLACFCTFELYFTKSRYSHLVMILAGGTASSGESKIAAMARSQMANVVVNPESLNKYNTAKVDENLKLVVEKLVDYFLTFNVKLQGYILQPFYDRKSNSAVIPGNAKLMSKDLLDRTKFFLLLHLRRIVTTFEGHAEDYLDEVTGYKNYKMNAEQNNLSAELQDLVSGCFTNEPFAKMQVDEAKTQSLQGLVIDSFTRHAKRSSPELLKLVLNDRSKSVESVVSDPASLKPQPITKLSEGVRTLQTLERELENAQLKVKISQEYVAIQEASNKELRTKLLKDVVHLRDTLFRKNAERLRDDEVYRVDYFTVNDVADEPIRLLLNDKISKIDQAFSTRLKKLEDQLQEANRLVKDYDQQLNSNNPGVISTLLKRVHGLLGQDNNLLWKVLQESIGDDWFQRVLIKRELNHRYHIEYEPLDSILPELNKIVMRKNPGEASKLGSQMDNVLLSYLIETFQDQKRELLKEINSKQQNRAATLIQQYDELAETEGDGQEREADLQNQNHQTWVDPSPRSNIGPALSVSIKVSETRPGRGLAASKVETGKSVDMKSSPKSSSNQIADDRAIFRGEDGSELPNSGLKPRFRMLLNEIHNLRSDKINMGQSLAALQGQFKILEGLVLELAEGAGVMKDGLALTNLVGKCKKLDAKILQKNNFNKILAQGKTEAIARMAIMGSLNTTGNVHKSTNTETSEYDDLAYSSSKQGAAEPFREAVTKVIKMKSRIKDNESVRSSGSKLSLSKKFSTLRESRIKQPDSPKLSMNKKLTLDSLVEEPDQSPMVPESMTKESPVKQKNPTLSQMEFAHQRNKLRDQQMQGSPNNPRRGSKIGAFHDITHSMEFGAPSKGNQGYDEKMAANIRVRRFESDSKPAGADHSVHSHTVNSKNQGSAFEDYSITKLKRVESLSNDSDGEPDENMIRHRMVSETRTNQAASPHRGEEKSSPLKGGDRKSKTMLPKELLEPSSPGSDQEQGYFRQPVSELETFHKLDFFLTGGVQIHGSKKQLIRPQLELFSGATFTEGGLAGKFDSSLATAAMRLQSGHTGTIDDPAGLIEGGFARRPKKRSQQHQSPLRHTSIMKTSQFEVPEVDSTDSPRLNTLSGLNPRDVRLKSPSKPEIPRAKTPSSKIVMKSLVSKDEKPKFSGANLKRWQDRANSSLVDDSNTSRSKRERETDRSLAPLPDKQRAIMRPKHTTTDSMLIDRNTREEQRKAQNQSRGNDEFAIGERRPNSATGTQNKFYEDSYQVSQERVKTGKLAQPGTASRSKSRNLGSNAANREPQSPTQKMITQSGNLDDSINPWRPSANAVIGPAVNANLRPPHDEIQTDSDLERIKLTMRQQESSAREHINPNPGSSSPFKQQQKVVGASKSLSPQPSPKKQEQQAAFTNFGGAAARQAAVPQVPRLRGLPQPATIELPAAPKKSKSPEQVERVHERLFQEAQDREEARELKVNQMQSVADAKWSGVLQQNTGVLCRLTF